MKNRKNIMKHILKVFLIILFFNCSNTFCMNKINFSPVFKHIFSHKKSYIMGLMPFLMPLLLSQISGNRISLQNAPDITEGLYRSVIEAPDPKPLDENARLLYYFHGLGETARNFTLRSIVFKNFLLIIPIFTETVSGKFIRSHFGQTGDVIDALKSIKETHGSFNNATLIGRSRGGHVAANVLAVLCTENHWLLDKAGISEEERKMIVAKFRTGIIILDVPLISMRKTLQYKFGRVLGDLTHFWILPIASIFRYMPRSQMRALKSLKEATEHGNFDIRVIFAKDDEVVGPLAKETFKKLLNTFNQKEIQYIEVEGGHNAYYQSKALQDIVMQYMSPNNIFSEEELLERK